MIQEIMEGRNLIKCKRDYRLALIRKEPRTVVVKKIRLLRKATAEFNIHALAARYLAIMSYKRYIRYGIPVEERAEAFKALVPVMKKFNEDYKKYVKGE